MANNVFQKRRTITLSTGWYKYGLALEVAKIGIVEAQLFTRQAAEGGKNSKEDWAVVLESWMGSRRVQEVAAWFQGIPSWVAGITNSPECGYGGPGGLVFHQARAEDDPRGLELYQGGVGVILEAWYHTRTAGTDVVHGATTACIPTAARGIDLQGAVIKYWGSMVTAATGIQVGWYTGILSDWYTGGLVYWYS